MAELVAPETVFEKLKASRKLLLEAPDDDMVTVAVSSPLASAESRVVKSICSVPTATLVVPAATAAAVTSSVDGAVNDARKLVAALDGTADINPKPNADTATSAMRLRSVFVDICFLSISRSEEFPPVGFG
jgi:phage-related tail fiber protein